MARLFALDQNFPQPIVRVLQDFQADAELVPVSAIDPRMSELDDWQLLLALHHHERPWDGLITTDSSILFQPLELAVLIQTCLTLVVTLEAGHNPVKATGLLFTHLAGICKRTRADEPQLWRLQAKTQRHVEPWEQLKIVAGHQHADARPDQLCSAQGHPPENMASARFRGARRGLTSASMSAQPRVP